MSQLYQHIVWLFSLPIYAILIPLEVVLSYYQHLKFYSLKETLMNVYLNILNIGVDFLLRGVALAVLIFFFNHHAAIHYNPIVYWLVLFAAEDFFFWLEHYIDHHCRFFWAVHVTHHSSNEYNLTTGFRSSVFMPFYRYLYFIPLALLAFEPLDIFFMYAITQVYGILVHTQSIKKMPVWFEAVFVSPAHHRVHHASNIPYLDRNMGMVLIIWDRLFKTFTPEISSEKPRYGLVKPIPDHLHPVNIVFHEWKALGADIKKSKNLKTKLQYLFKPPGWSHDGTTKTSIALQKEWNNNRLENK